MTIDPRGLIGFALALFATGWVLSLVLGGGFLAVRGRLARRGPEVERAAAAATLVLPALLAVALVAALAGHSLLIGWGGAPDHCPVHSHHPHLCLFHGAGWTHTPWAMVALAVLATLALVRAVQLVAHRLAAARALARIARAGQRVLSGPVPVVVVPSLRAFFFVAGTVQPRIFVSDTAWAALGGPQRAAALAHETAHARRRDLLRAFLLELAGLVAAPIFHRHLLTIWWSATERVCDEEAAAAVGSREEVAGALLALARLGAHPCPGAAFHPNPAGVVERVEALLGPPVQGRALVILWLTVAVAAIATAAAVAAAAPLHHALETILGIL